jgi:carbohydrate-selective porin OprB
MLRLPSGLQNTRRPFARQLIGPVVPKHYVQPQRPIDTQRAKVLRLRIIFIFTAAITALFMVAVPALAENDKKTDDDKPADPDTGESTVQEKTLGLLPNPLQKYGIKFAATYIGETLGNVSGGIKRGAVYEGRLNLAVDVDLQKLVGVEQLTFHANMFQIHGGGRGGAIASSGAFPGQPHKNAAVFGLRTTLKF